MAKTRGLGRDVRDILVGVLAGASVLAGGGCSEPFGPQGSGGPIDGGPRRRSVPTVAGATTIDVAALYVDKPPRFSLLAAGASSILEMPASDFEALTWVSDSGGLMGTVVDGAPTCDEALVVAGSGTTRTVPTDYPTIQAAIDAAAAGDIVFVEPGVYQEHLSMRSHVSLVGAGADKTVIDGGGQGVSLIDYTSAKNVVVRGFTLSGVGVPTVAGCVEPADPFLCAGPAYTAAIYGDGHNVWARIADVGDPCGDTSITVTQNVIRDSSIGMMAYFHARAVVRNNLFIGNQYGFVANHMNDQALLLNNAFIDNQQLAIGGQAAYLDIVGNIVAGSATGLLQQYMETGHIACNGFVAVGNVGERVPVGEQGNLLFEQAFVDPANGDFRPTPELTAALATCLAGQLNVAASSSPEPGAFGGTLGRWNPRVVAAAP